jgi:hypothetical protein
MVDADDPVVRREGGDLPVPHRMVETKAGDEDHRLAPADILDVQVHTGPTSTIPRHEITRRRQRSYFLTRLLSES